MPACQKSLLLRVLTISINKWLFHPDLPKGRQQAITITLLLTLLYFVIIVNLFPKKLFYLYVNFVKFPKTAIFKNMTFELA